MRLAYTYTILLLLLAACRQADYSPKPRGYFRIDFPAKTYIQANTGCPFTMEIPTYARFVSDPAAKSMECWKNVDFPSFNARLHLSYYPIGPTTPFNQLTEDARTFVYKHTAKATGIEQERLEIPETAIYGIAYNIRGNTASNYQFYVSDSTRHYLRGALYFQEKPNQDSIKPVIDFLREDIQHMISTIRWK